MQHVTNTAYYRSSYLSQSNKLLVH